MKKYHPPRTQGKRPQGKPRYDDKKVMRVLKFSKPFNKPRAKGRGGKHVIVGNGRKG